ncbi:MAG: hypothetical protein O3C40_33010 [Planctomycetota bacterium]|nr:hypothetical protein [Planctomycetota bacterium]
MMKLRKSRNGLPAICMIAVLNLSMTNVVGADKKQVRTEASTAFHVPSGQRQLFLDDHGIEKIENLRRTMHRPDKKGAVIRPDPQMGEDFIQTRTAPVWDSEKRVFKFWTLYGPGDLPGVSGYYESKDGLHWYKPNVGQIEYRGSRENNYIAVQTAKGRRGITMVVYDAAAPDPAQRFKSFLPNVGFAVSPDGIRWKMLDVPPVSSADNFSFSFDENSHTFFAAVKRGGPHGRSVGLATSTDFTNWTDHGLVFHADELDQKVGLENIKARYADPTLHHPCYNIPSTYNVDVYMKSIFVYEGLYIGMPAMYHQTGKVPGNWGGFDDLPISPHMLKLYRADGDWAGFHDVQLTCSRDLKNWKRLGDRKPFIGSSRLGSGAYDTANIKAPSRPVVRGDELWLYYTAGRYYGVVLDRPSHRLAGAICLAVLRRDGFISLDAGEQEGTVLTRSFKIPGKRLFVNVDASEGDLHAEVLDMKGKVLARSDSMKGDLARAEVKWRQDGIAAFAGEVVSIRFTLRNAEFYSYWFDED